MATAITLGTLDIGDGHKTYSETGHWRLADF